MRSPVYGSEQLCHFLEETIGAGVKRLSIDAKLCEFAADGLFRRNIRDASHLHATIAALVKEALHL
jgi:hypothetical protein